MRDIFAKTLLQLALKDPKILLISGDLGFRVFDEFRERLPGQFLNAGVAEQNMSGLATGLALSGRTVFTYSIANFPTLRCLEQIRNDICYHQANVKVVSVGAGFSYGALGMSHHATEDISILRSLPDLTMFSPCDDWETVRCTELLATAVGPAYLRLDRMSAQTSAPASTSFSPGTPRLLRPGRDLLFIGTGEILSEVLQAAALLEQKKISVGVASLHTLKPMNREALRELVFSYPHVISVEEHVLSGGLGSAILEALSQVGLAGRVAYRFGVQDTFASIVGDQKYLRHAFGLTAEAFAQKAQEILA